VEFLGLQISAVRSKGSACPLAYCLFFAYSKYEVAQGKCFTSLEEVYLQVIMSLRNVQKLRADDFDYEFKPDQ